MKINNKIISKKYSILKNIFQHTLGMMFSKQDLLFIFKKDFKISFHTWFVFCTIDIIFIDNKKKVIEMKRMPPFRTYNPKKHYRYVFETPNKIIEKINIGDSVSFK